MSVVVLLLTLFLFGVCQAHPHYESKIIGGQDAQEGTFPYMVSLRDSQDRFVCGGCIITKRTVMTAASCLHGVQPNDFKVATGSVKLDSSSIRYQPTKFIHHRYFEPTVARGDVALVILNEDIVFDANTQPIAIGEEEIGTGVEVTLSGWGTTSASGSIPNNLQYAKVKTVSFAECENLYQGVHQVFLDNMCTANDRTQGGCQNDFGSVAALNGKVVGVASWGFGCESGKPDVLTRIASYASWINNYKE